MDRAQYRLPEFLGIGPQRTGTTWLDVVLRGHADLPQGVKETWYFERNYTRGIDWYASHFPQAGKRRVGEISPLYFAHPPTAERVKNDLPDCKIVICFRDPVDRVYSVYKMMTAFAWVRGPFEEVLEKRPDLDHENLYATHLKRWLDRFPRENFLITWYEDLLQKPQQYMDRFCEFSGVEKFQLTAPGERVHQFQLRPRNRKLAQNARHVFDWLREHRAYRLMKLVKNSPLWSFCFSGGDPHPRLTAEQDARLRQKYLSEIDELERLLGVDLSRWKRTREAQAA